MIKTGENKMGRQRETFKPGSNDLIPSTYADYEPLSDAVEVTARICNITRYQHDHIGPVRLRHIRKLNIEFLRGRLKMVSGNNLARLKATIQNLESQI